MAKDVGAPGLVAAVKLPDGSVWYGAEGVLWPGGPEATPDTPFAWGSITKTFVAALTLRAATAGQLGLDQTIDAWLPEIRGADRITVRMLLAHRSGLFDYFQHKDYPGLVFERPGHAWTIDGDPGPQRTAASSRPGRGFSYSNTNYVLLGLILEQVTGQPLATLIHDQLLAPLGMDQTVFQQAGQPVGLVGAKGFWKTGKGFREWSDGTDFRPTTSDRDRGLGRGRHGGERPRPARLGDGALRRPGADPGRARPDAGHVQGLGLRPGRPHPDGGRQGWLRSRRVAARVRVGDVSAARRGPRHRRARERRASPTSTGSPTGWPRPPSTRCRHPRRRSSCQPATGFARVKVP